MRRLSSICLCSLLLGGGTAAQAKPASAPPPPKPASVQPAVYAAFAGQWTGTLEYRDYQTNKRVKLPTTLMIQTSLDGAALRWDYSYDDGPGKTVEETESVTINPAAGTYCVLADGDKKPNCYQAADLLAFAKARLGKLVLLGSGEDNNKKADFRKTITVTLKTLTILKEVRPPGSNFQFRNQYNFIRVQSSVPLKPQTHA